MSRAPTVLLRDPTAPRSRWWRVDEPLAILQTSRLDEVLSLLDEVESEVESGRIAAGYLAYESAPAFDNALRTHEECPLPLAWFALFDEPARDVDPPSERPPLGPLDWRATIDEERHRDAVDQIREAIAAGSTYQVNFTHRLRAPFDGDPLALLAQLERAQPTPYAAYFDLGEHAIASASPELFFLRRGERVFSRPMKGTAPRGRTLEEDETRATELATSEKDRSENLMIVDMVRNDLGRIARPGSVRVPRLFEVERYRTVHQMVSDIEAETDATLRELLTALFPPASITGAPKPSTTQWIRALEGEPRGIYTGAIGVLRPGRRADFSVAIRTAHVDRVARRVEYGTGGGIVWDSTPEAEWLETRTKALILRTPGPDASPSFRLLETIGWTADGGYRLLEEHLDRLERSARYFGFAFDRTEIARALAEAEPNGDGRWGVRLLYSGAGRSEIEAAPLRELGQRVAVASAPVRSDDRYLFHKTNHREAYDRALAEHPGADDVLLWNEHGRWTESCRANLVVVLDGEPCTPPVSCGLLAGAERAVRLRDGRLSEREIGNEEIFRADEIYLINSVRGRIDLDRDALERGIRALGAGVPD